MIHSGQDKRLTARMLVGDRTSFESVAALYADDVFRLSYSLLWNREEAEDVVQETFLTFVRHVRDGLFRQNNGSIKGFLLTVARNQCIDRLRKKSRFIERLDDIRALDELRRGSNTPDAVAHHRDVEAAFQSGLAQLTDLQRTILVLHDLNEEPSETIAADLGLSAINVRTHLCRARKRMRTILEPYRDER